VHLAQRSRRKRHLVEARDGSPTAAAIASAAVGVAEPAVRPGEQSQRGEILGAPAGGALLECEVVAD
jgi:hypothetical protein